MNIALRSSKTVRREVRPGCPLHCFTFFQSFSNHFHTAFPLPCNLPGIEFFREGNLPVPILPMPVFRRE